MTKWISFGTLAVLASVVAFPASARDYFINVSGTANGVFDPDETDDFAFTDASFFTQLILTVPSAGATVTKSGGTTTISGDSPSAVPLLFTGIDFESSQVFTSPDFPGFDFYLSDPDSPQTGLDDGTVTATLSRSAKMFSLDVGREDFDPTFELQLSVAGAGNVFGSSNLTTPFSYADPAGIGTGSYGDSEPHGFGMYANLTITSISLTPASPVPEPAAWAMMVGGVGFVGGMVRKRPDRVRFV